MDHLEDYDSGRGENTCLLVSIVSAHLSPLQDYDISRLPPHVIWRGKSSAQFFSGDICSQVPGDKPLKVSYKLYSVISYRPRY